MRIAMIGLGALGGIYLDRLSRGLPDAEVAVIADGARADRLERDGLVINGERRVWPVMRPDDPTEAADLLIIATKAGGLDDAIRLAAPHVGDGTTVLSLINGVHSEPILANAFPTAHVIPSMTAGSDVVRRGSEIRFANFGRIAFGDPAQDVAVRRLAGLFDAADVPHEVPGDMTHVLWWKFMGNVGINPSSALLDAEYGAYQRAGSYARSVMLAAQREVIAIANAQGIDLGEADIESWLDTVARLDPAGETSMLQDMRAARPTEIDIFAGEVVRQGERLGVPTPVNALMLDAIRAREQVLGAR